MPNSLTRTSRDSFERRLVWTVPGACLLGLSLLWLAALFLGQGKPLPAPEQPVDAQLIEMPPPSAPVRHTPAPPRPTPSKDRLPVQHAAPAPKPQSEPPVAPVAPSTSSNKLSNTGGARAILSPLPKIPDDLRDVAINMAVTARFHIAVDGSARVELIQPTPNPRLNRLVLEALQQWCFFPAVENGHPVASVEEVHIKIQ